MGDIVWSEARQTEVQVLTAADAEDAFLPDDRIHGTHALFVGGDLGLVVAGDLAGLRRVAEQIMQAVRGAGNAAHLPPCATGYPSQATDGTTGS